MFANRAVKFDRKTDDEVMPAIYNANERLSMEQQRLRLPIAKVRRELLYLVETHDTVVVVGETGCGKSTQLPQYLAEAGWAAGERVIACTQPRRIAATSLAERVAQEAGCILGTDVGYSVRFDHCYSDELTKIKYVTDGMLLREVMLDPLLARYAVVLVDEAHERHLDTDILLGLLKKIQRQRRGLKLIIASATIDAEAMRDFFNHKRPDGSDSCAIATIEGRSYPVEIHYLIEPTSDYVNAAVQTVLDIHRSEPAGDILVFLTGQAECDEAVRMLHEQAPNYRSTVGLSLSALPMHASLHADEQKRAFAPAPRGMRKVVVATNVAEASITIDGIVYVVDSGFVKLRTFDPRSGADALVVTQCSQASAQQRAGRAGRVAPGKCYRLYCEPQFASLPEHTPPEMQRTALDSVVIQLKALGVENVLRFDFASAPPIEALIRSLELLYALGLLDINCQLTRRGRRVALLPLTPTLATALVRSHSFGVRAELLSIVAMLSVEEVFPMVGGVVDAKGFAVYEGDHLTLLNAFNAYKAWCQRRGLRASSMRRAASVREQLSTSLRQSMATEKRVPGIDTSVGVSDADDKDDIENSAMFAVDERVQAAKMHRLAGNKRPTDIDSGVDDEAELGLSARVRKALVSGLFGNAAARSGDGSYRTVRGKDRLYIDPSSVLFQRPPQWLIYYEVVYTQKQYMKEISAISPNWLTDVAPHFYTFRAQVDIERERGKGVSVLLKT